ncbi:MAG: hypothetical protein OEV29_04885 [Thermoleophilia bacterium]|nr:hypothetical protein [Thermoleophilia bacterium]MDH4339979.1 hypothetical protein [Thermoleophilia bacterium]
MAALAGLVAHGGVAGAFVEALIALAVILVLGAVWIRERQARRDQRERSESPSDEGSSTS